MAITAQFSADFSQWSSAVAGAQNDLDGLKQSADQVALDKAAEEAGRAMADFGRQVLEVGSDFVESYAESEAAAARLNAALQAQGVESAAVQQAYEEMATQFQNTTRYSDDAITKAQTLFTEIGQVGPDQMQAALTAATNLSAGLGISLESATMMVAKAFATGGESLGRLKVLLGDTVPKGADMAQVLEAINGKFGGQAQADVETYNGSMARLANQMDDVKERIGGLIAQAITPLLNAFESLPAPVQTVVAMIGVVGTALAPLAIAFGSVMTALAPLLPALAVALPAAFAALTPFLLPAGVIIGGIIAVYEAFKHWDQITAIVASVYTAIKTYLVDKFQAIVGWIGDKVNAVTGFFSTMYEKVVGHSYVPDMIDGIQQQFGRLTDVMVKPAQDAAGAVTGALKNISGGISLPGSTVVDQPGGGRYLVSPEGFRVPMGGTGYLPTNWYDMYTGKTSAASGLNNWFLNPRPADTFGTRTNITINGSVLGNKDEIARVVGDAVMSNLTRPGVTV